MKSLIYIHFAMFGRNVGRKCVLYIRAFQVGNYTSDFVGFYK
jgi:hypothetical protein